MTECDVDCPDCYERRIMEFGVPVLDKGFVRVDHHDLDDKNVIVAAKVSFANPDLTDVDWNRFIGFLMKNRHGTPFEHGSVTFHIKCPILVAREWMRHRMGSFNEMSGRYTVLPAEWYVPPVEAIRTQTGKPGSYTFEPFESTAAAEIVRSIIDNESEQSFSAYQAMLDMNVAKEVARTVLPVNTYTMFYWTVNARSLMHWLSLRAAPDAQWEIRQYAYAISEMLGHLMPITSNAFAESGCIAP